MKRKIFNYYLKCKTIKVNIIAIYNQIMNRQRAIEFEIKAKYLALCRQIQGTSSQNKRTISDK